MSRGYPSSKIQRDVKDETLQSLTLKRARSEAAFLTGRICAYTYPALKPEAKLGHNGGRSHFSAASKIL